jgi:hypothetical protein
MLVLANQAETGEGVLWTRSVGAGHIIVSGFGTLFTNRALGLADNAQLLANIVGAALGPRGAVLFDDTHQGLGATYDPQRFFQDERLFATILILIGLWFVWVLGSTRLRAPVAHGAAPRESELIRASGAFLSRVLPPHEAALRLIDHFFRRMQQRAPAMREYENPWTFLAHNPRVRPADLELLRRWHAEARAGRRVSLPRLQNLLVRLDGRIA